MPKKAADEIRSIGTVIPRRYENVAVLFCDVTNFTAYCDKHEPEDVVSRLDALFVIFERLTAQHGLEKIKTIGDGFMAAGGLLHQVDDPIGSAVRCGLEMSSTLIDAHLDWEVRVGVHSGPVVAGVVGQERYQFDIWGDTVNVAARMSDKSKPGSVAVTKDVWQQVSSPFRRRVARGDGREGQRADLHLRHPSRANHEARLRAHFARAVLGFGVAGLAFRGHGNRRALSRRHEAGRVSPTPATASAS